MALYLLFEAASGYALFEAEGMNELAQETDALQQVSLLTRTKTWARRGLANSKLAPAATRLLRLPGKLSERRQATQLGPGLSLE